MVKPTRLTAALLSAAALSLFLSRPGPALADQPVVVELFTSQSCSSCPPAEAYLGALARRPDLVALEWHVDYWDDLDTRTAGRWRDRFSDPAFTARQRTYNRVIRGTPQVYTPQMVVGGQREAVGSHRAAVEAAIAASSGDVSVSLTVTSGADGRIAVAVEGGVGNEAGDGPELPASVWLVRFLGREATAVAGGENYGRTLANHHVVIAGERLGPWPGGPAAFSAAGPAEAGRGCAVLVQVDGQGPILGAAYCPE